MYHFQYEKRKISLNDKKSAAMEFLPGTRERVRNSCGKQAISVRAIEVLLYLEAVWKSDVNNFNNNYKF